MTVTKSMDRLSLLPNELLDDIFDLFHTETEPLTGPLSKRLLPFFHRSFYRDILIPSYEQLDRLCQTSRDRFDLISTIRTFRLEIPTIEDAEGESETETKDPNFPSSNSILELLSQLVSLQKLRLQGSSRVACLLLSPPDKRHYPFSSKLFLLQLRASFYPHPDPFQYLLFSALPEYQALTSMTLDVIRSASTIDSILQRPGGGVIHLRQLSIYLRHFTLVGPLAASRYADMLLELVPVLTGLRIHNNAASFPRVRELLSRIQRPQFVTSLALLASSVDQLSSHALSPLRLFTRLESIELDLTASFGDIMGALPQPPLRHIALLDACNVATSALANVVSGNTKVRTLKELELNNIVATRGRPVPREMAREELEILDPEDLDWYLPRWTLEFSRDGFKEFLALARKEGIKVTGAAVEALEVEDEWEEEMEYYRSVIES